MEKSVGFADDFDGTYLEGGYGNTLTIRRIPRSF